MWIFFIFMWLFSFVTIYDSYFAIAANAITIVIALYFLKKFNIKDFKFVLISCSSAIVINIYELINQNHNAFYFLIKLVTFYFLFKIFFSLNSKINTKKMLVVLAILSFTHIALNFIVIQLVLVSPKITGAITGMIIFTGVLITILGSVVTRDITQKLS